MIEKVPCTKCDVPIMPSTAKKTGGVCIPCQKGTRRDIEERKRIAREAKNTPPENEFVCLECGSEISGEQIQAGVSYSGDDPWSHVAARERCYKCGVEMPRFLTRRWNNESVKDARNIWIEKYRPLKQGP